MASTMSEAEKIFWETPELLEKLLPFLDPESTLTLVQCHKKILRILEGPYMWNQLIRRACPFSDERDGLTNISQKDIDARGNVHVQEQTGVLPVRRHTVLSCLGSSAGQGNGCGSFHPRQVGKA